MRAILSKTGSNVVAKLSRSSSTGIVNVYSSQTALQPSDSGLPAERKPLKTILNLTTTVDTVQFNHDSQLLALASSQKKDALKMVRCRRLGHDIRLMCCSIGSFAELDGLCQLADATDTTWACHVGQLFEGEPICGDWQRCRQSFTVHAAELFAIAVVTVTEPFHCPWTYHMSATHDDERDYELCN